MRVTLVAALVLLAVSAGTAAAYPQLGLSTGNDRCTACHVAPSGGGLLNAYGRDEAGGTISGRGDGRFAHGAVELPSWLELGGDVRLALGGKQLEGEAPTVLAFPMQGDLYARVVAGPVSLNITAGLNGAARSRPAGAPPLSYAISREHHVMYEPADSALVVRAGRFFPVFGLRTQDHTAYVRRYLDQYILEEPYALEAGWRGDAWQGHVAGFLGNPVPLTGAGPRASGATAMIERRVPDVATLAAQAKVAVTDEDRRYLVGGVARWWLPGPGLLAMAELDVQRQSFVGADAGRWQLAGYAGVTKVILPGYLLGAAIQRWAPDLMLRGATRSAVELNVQVFPWAHVELHLLTRVEATGGDTTTPNLLGLLQLHYYL